MPESPIRVLIVDDSAFARKVIREVVSPASDIEIVGIARDGLDALEQCAAKRPHVITLDLMMPELDGIGVLRALADMDYLHAGQGADLDTTQAPRVVVVSSTALDSALAVQALQLGAFSIVQKPTALASDRLYELGEQLLEQVRLAASSLLQPREAIARGADLEVGTSQSAKARSEYEVVVIGTSTGGPQALTRVLGSLPAHLAVPLAAVVHIPIGYTASLAERIDRSSAISVLEAREGLEVGPGMAVIARAGVHLTLERLSPRWARCVLSPEPLGHLHCPAVDVLFTSAANAFGSNVLGVVLTGMGDDGLVGARAIRAAKGEILTEHPASSVIDGMPRMVREAGLSNDQIALSQMARAIVARV